MADEWGLLDEKEEQELHKARLLNVEERPFKRIKTRLHTLDTLVKQKRAKDQQQKQTPPPESASNGNSENAAEGAQPADNDAEALAKERDLLKENIILDFSAFDSSIARLQFLLDANERERQRYADDQQRILNESQAVRENNATLRERLEEARGTLTQRKKFDKMADDITGGKSMLRPREDQRAAIRKLEEECVELEKESGTYAEVWRERKDQFERIMDEAMRLRRQIRDEKEEVERREGMNEDGEEDGEVSTKEGGTPAPHPGSRGTTPRPDGEAGTPRPSGTSGGRTPAGESQGEDGSLKPRGDDAMSRSGSVGPSQAGTPHAQPDEGEIEEGEDVEMGEEDSGRQQHSTQGTSRAETPRITVDAPNSTAGAPGDDDEMDVDNQGS